jgi:hypothetical protein
MGTYPKVKQTEKAIPIRARDFDLVSVSVTSPIMAVLSWTFPSLSPPIKRESRKDAYSQLGGIVGLTKVVDLSHTTADKMLPVMVANKTFFRPYRSDTTVSPIMKVRLTGA